VRQGNDEESRITLASFTQKNLSRPLQELLQGCQHQSPVFLGVLARMLRRIVVLGPGHTGPLSVGRQLNGDDVAEVETVREVVS
jgi:hypothetical protein